jgi:polyhydroxybutyrate depolymerase
VDDLGYVDDLMKTLQELFPVDSQRIYSVGISNGGAMSYRLACTRSEIFAGIASIGGGNQGAQVQGCTPSRPVAILEEHGTGDLCWPFEGGTGACVQRDGDQKVSVEESLVGTEEVPGWAR